MKIIGEGNISRARICLICHNRFYDYKAGRIIVLYIGSKAKILDLFEQVLGPEFAVRLERVSVLSLVAKTSFPDQTFIWETLV